MGTVILILLIFSSYKHSPKSPTKNYADISPFGINLFQEELKGKSEKLFE